MTTPSGPVPPDSRAASLRMLAIALGTAPLAVVAAMVFVLPTAWDDEPPVAVVLGLVALVGLAFATAELVGFAAPALTPQQSAVEDAQAASVAHFQTMMFLRFALTEMPILVGLAVSFVLDHGLWPLLVTVVVGLPVLWFEVWPGRRNATRLARSLESGGVRSWLPEALGTA